MQHHIANVALTFHFSVTIYEGTVQIHICTTSRWKVPCTTVVQTFNPSPCYSFKALFIPSSKHQQPTTIDTTRRQALKDDISSPLCDIPSCVTYCLTGERPSAIHSAGIPQLCPCKSEMPFHSPQEEAEKPKENPGKKGQRDLIHSQK